MDRINNHIGLADRSHVFLSTVMKPDHADDLRFHLRRDGRVIAWREFGDPEGKPVFYYHGWPGSSGQAQIAAEAAAQRGLRIIALDRPGIGHSSFVPGRRLEDWPALIDEFADGLGIGRFLQLSVSGGGPYVLACASAMPERIAGSAVLCGAVPIRGDTSGFHPLYRLLIPCRNLPPICFSPLFLTTRWLTRGGRLHRPAGWLLNSLPRVDRESLAAAPEAIPVFIRSFHDAIRQGAGPVLADAAIYLDEWNLDLPNIRSEVRYWHGTLDSNIPIQRAREFISGISHAILHEHAGLGHYSLALQHAAEALDYLATRNLR